ncbi:MAG: XRE family transcriptional regulator [Pseudoruegeria sp.]
MTDLSERLAKQLRWLRDQRSWSLEQASRESGVGRATISRLENAGASPTTDVLGKLCFAYGQTMSQLLSQVEQQPRALIRHAEQPFWTDLENGFKRRVLSPLTPGYTIEMLECSLPPGAEISYDGPPGYGMEHHLFLQQGKLQISLEEERHELDAGDVVRYRLTGRSKFTTPVNSGANYIISLIPTERRND